MFEGPHNRGSRGQSRSLVYVSLVVAALREGEQLSVCVQLFLDDRSHLMETLHPHHREDARGQGTDRPTDQQNELAANAQIIEEFAHRKLLRRKDSVRPRVQVEITMLAKDARTHCAGNLL